MRGDGAARASVAEKPASRVSVATTSRGADSRAALIQTALTRPVGFPGHDGYDAAKGGVYPYARVRSRVCSRGSRKRGRPRRHRGAWAGAPRYDDIRDREQRASAGGWVTQTRRLRRSHSLRQVPDMRGGFQPRRGRRGGCIPPVPGLTRPEDLANRPFDLPASGPPVVHGRHWHSH
jgi:hypothetical protein